MISYRVHGRAQHFSVARSYVLFRVRRRVVGVVRQRVALETHIERARLKYT
jgi:hypothetical protein